VSQETSNRYFDELAREVASGTLSRGRMLRLMGAAFLGGTLASLGIGESAADQCKRNGKVCKKDTQCCSGKCEGGKCVCPTINCGVGTLNQNTCTCECTPAAAGDCARNSNPNFQGCCPNLQSFGCVPRGTVCSPPTS
jgi:hypothetical protein